MGLFDRNYYKPNAQADAVRAYLSMWDGVEASYDTKTSSYANVNIAEWHNGRERGYVVSFWNKKTEQINIAFFEHRNSDDICALAWVQNTLNPPTIDNAEFGGIYNTKYDVSYMVRCGEALKMAEWIMDQLTSHWGKA